MINRTDWLWSTIPYGTSSLTYDITDYGFIFRNHFHEDVFAAKLLHDWQWKPQKTNRLQNETPVHQFYAS